MPSFSAHLKEFLAPDSASGLPWPQMPLKMTLAKMGQGSDGQRPKSGQQIWKSFCSHLSWCKTLCKTSVCHCCSVARCDIRHWFKLAHSIYSVCQPQMVSEVIGADPECCLFKELPPDLLFGQLRACRAVLHFWSPTIPAQDPKQWKSGKHGTQ